MTGRELLEAAAKAAGFNGQTDRQGFFRVESENGLWPMWNPLTDDGDELRLAVKLCIGVEAVERCAVANVRYGDTHCEAFGSDPYAATRRAIVRAAAMASPDRLGA